MANILTHRSDDSTRRLREALEEIKDYALGGWLNDDSIAFPEDALWGIGTMAEEGLKDD